MRFQAKKHNNNDYNSHNIYKKGLSGTEKSNIY